MINAAAIIAAIVPPVDSVPDPASIKNCNDSSSHSEIFSETFNKNPAKTATPIPINMRITLMFFIIMI